MRNALGFAVFVAACFLTFQGYENSQPREDTLELSRDRACSLYGGCAKGRPTKVLTDVIRRRYEWLTPEGPVTVSCRRSGYFVGAWSCGQPESGQLSIAGDY